MSGLNLAQLTAHGFIKSAYNLFDKANPRSVCFVKTGANTLALKAGTTVAVAGRMKAFPAQTNVLMPALVAGTDYTIYACGDATLRADASQTAPAGYTVANSRAIGGFHYGLVPAGETLVGGLFNTVGNVTTGGMVWTQADVDAIAGINAFSLWDLRWRPACSPRGMAYQPGGFWADIYLCNTDVDALGTSAYNAPVASGTVLPKVPAAFGGNGVVTYANCNWWTSSELAASQGKRLFTEVEFIQAAFGVTEAQALGGASVTIPSTLRQPGYTSKTGCEQMTGNHWIWSMDSNGRDDGSTTYSWKNTTTGRGQVYALGTYGITRQLLGGARHYGSMCGSRASFWGDYPWDSHWAIGLRARGDHLVLMA
jgi:hypothetical protein